MKNRKQPCEQKQYPRQKYKKTEEVLTFSAFFGKKTFPFALFVSAIVFCRTSCYNTGKGADTVMRNFYASVKEQGPFVLDLLVSVAVVMTTTWSSGQTAAVSGGASRGIVSWFLSYLPGVYTQDTIALLDHLLRKTAHFTLYFILGFSLTGCFQRQSHVPPALAALLTGAVLAGLDEFHQIFVDGRGPMLSDVFLDTCGVAAGCLLRTHKAWSTRARKPKE